MNYTGLTKGVQGYPRYEVMKHFVKGKNIGLLLPRQAITEKFVFFVCNTICDINYTGSAGQFGAGLVFPLYLYPEATQTQTAHGSARTPNLKPEIVAKFAEKLGLQFVAEKSHSVAEALEATRQFAPIDMLDYIYAVLHSPTYRKKYKEFLKIDFPRVPYPKNAEAFWKLVSLGAKLRQIHLLETDLPLITQYPESGDNLVVKPQYVPIAKNEKTGALQGNVFINDTQYFANVPLSAWSFFIGGYQPAQKWLKDRKYRTLSFENILHYQKIIAALCATEKLMQEIDEVGAE